MKEALDVQYLYNNTMKWIWWKSFDTGECSIEYHIEFEYDNGTVFAEQFHAYDKEYISRFNNAVSFKFWMMVNNKKIFITQGSLFIPEILKGMSCIYILVSNRMNSFIVSNHPLKL